MKIRFGTKDIMFIGAIFSVFVIALIIRLYNLTILPVFADEAIYIRWSQIMANEPTLRFLPLSDGKQPLYMWILMFAVSRFQDPLFIGRLVSVGAGMGSMFGIMLVSFFLFRSRKAAVLSGFLYAISPFAIFFDRMALVDSLLNMCGIWALLFGIITSRTRRIDTAIVTGFFIGLATLTKSPGVFFALLLPVTWLLANWTRDIKDNLSIIVQLFFLAVISVGIAFGMYNIQRLGPNFHQLSARTQDYVYPISHIFERPLDPLLPHFDRSLEWIRILGPSMLFVLVGVGVVLSIKGNSKKVLVLLIWSIVPILVQSEFAKVFTARYIYFTLPPLYILSGNILSKSKVRLVLIICIGLFTLQSLKNDFYLLKDPEKAKLPRSERSGYLEEWTAGQGILQVAKYLKETQSQNPSQKIVVGTEGYFGTLPDGLQMYMQNTPNTLVIGVGLSISEPPVSLLESRKAGNRTYLVINSSRLNLKSTAESVGLKEILKIPKAERPSEIKEHWQYGPRDYLYLFEVTQ